MYSQASTEFETFFTQLALVVLLHGVNVLLVLFEDRLSCKHPWTQITFDSLFGVLEQVLVQQAVESETLRTVLAFVGFITGVRSYVFSEYSFT